MTTPKPPPGFVMIDAQAEGLPPLPPGFEMIGNDAGGEADLLSDVGNQAVAGFYRGLDSLVRLPGSIVGGAINIVAPGTYEGAPIIEPPSTYITGNNPVPQTVAGRVADMAGQAVGASVLPMAGMAARAGQAARVVGPQTTMGRVGREMLAPYRTAPVQAARADTAAAAATGATYQGLVESGVPEPVAGLAAPAGVLASSVGRQAVGRFAQSSPLLQRFRGTPEPQPRSAGAAVNPDLPPPVSAAGRAQAEQMVANQLLRAGVSPDEIRSRLGRVDYARRMGSNSFAEDASVLADLDPSLAKLAGSTARQSPEAANLAAATIYSRQTGYTPETRLPRDSTLPTRPRLGRPMPGDRPMGQYERVEGALKRAFEIEDEAFHGHASSATRMDQKLVQEARDVADPLYKAAYKAGANVDLSPQVQRLASKWTQAAIDEPQPVARLIDRAVKQMVRAVDPRGSKPHIERLDKVKQYLDDEIEKLVNSANGRQRYTAGRLTELKNDLLSELDAVPNAGAKYAEARAAFSSRAEARDVINMGREVFKENGEIAQDVFETLSPQMQKLYKMGILDGFGRRARRLPRSADVTRLLESPDVQSVLQAVIKRSAKKEDVFYDRPERFGEYVGIEQNMLRTRNRTLGGSPTQDKIVDDAAYETMLRITSGIERLKQSQGLGDLAMKSLQYAVDKVFGLRADTARELAEILFTSNPEARLAILDNIAARTPPDRMQMLNRVIEDMARRGVGASSGVVAVSPREDGAR
jgi:hypothetical protein